MLTDIQKKLLYGLKWFHEYCVHNELTYYAAGGTVLGAMRHNGFIPWDDDIDVILPRKDYNRLINSFTEVIDHYYLESPYSKNIDFIYPYAKLYDIDTTLTEKTQVICRRGVYIDVFPLDGIGSTFEEAVKSLSLIDRKRNFLLTRNCVIRKDRVWYKNLAIKISQCLPSAFIDNKKMAIEIDQIADRINFSTALYVANTMGTYRRNEIFEKRLLGKPTPHNFEDMTIYIPEFADEYLTQIYGNWRKLPPEDKRYTKHDFVEYDLFKSYMD